MSTLNILKIEASARKAGSVSRQLSDQVVDRLVAENAQTNVVVRDLADGVPAVTESWIGANFTPADDRAPEQAALLELSDALVAELAAADVVVIGLPIYNFGMPAALKAWVDLVCRVGMTFHYTENGPEGLLAGKRAIVTVAAGGVPIGSPVDFASTHLKQVLNFVGITDVTVLGASNLAMDADAAIREAANEIKAVDLSWGSAA